MCFGPVILVKSLVSRAVQGPSMHAAVRMAAEESRAVGGEEQLLYRAPDRLAPMLRFRTVQGPAKRSAASIHA